VTKNGIAIENKIPIELTAKTTIGTSEQQSSSDYHARAIISLYIPVDSSKRDHSPVNSSTRDHFPIESIARDHISPSIAPRASISPSIAALAIILTDRRPLPNP
jgi:hypothetical protein